MIEHSKAVAQTQAEIEEMFERVEIATEALEEINKKYDQKLEELE